MRLVDADDLIRFEESVWDFDVINNITSKAVCKQILTDIRNQPTIEAIPVEWLEKNMGELIAQGHTVEASYFAEIISLWRDGEC